MLNDILKTQQQMLTKLTLLEERHSRTHMRIKEIQEDVAPLKVHVQQVKGGGKVLGLLASAIAIGSILISWFKV